ncbi:hypothetical protein GCM10010341_28390 [Streptomyces noursei]|nr:hypothetical protein GCM10010341_28390 [Streptomyces noursei]
MNGRRRRLHNDDVTRQFDFEALGQRAAGLFEQLEVLSVHRVLHGEEREERHPGSGYVAVQRARRTRRRWRVQPLPILTTVPAESRFSASEGPFAAVAGLERGGAGSGGLRWR